MTSSLVYPRPIATLGALLGFAFIGAIQATYGPLLPTLRTQFETNSAAIIISLQFLGSTLGILAINPLGRFLDMRTRTMLALVLLGAGCFGVALAGAWWVVLGSVLVLGLGFGGLEVIFNVVFARAFGERSAGFVNVMHGCFGVGAFVGPLLVALEPGAFRVLFFAFAAFAVALMPMLFFIPQPKDPENTAGRAAAFSLLGALFVLLYFLYVGLEVGAAGNETTHLQASLGLSQRSAAAWTAWFWGGMTVSRMLVAPIALRVAPQRIVLSAVLVCVLATALALHAPFAPWAYVVLGLACGPIYPTGLVWLARHVPNVAAVTAAAGAAGTLGAVLVPPLVERLGKGAAQLIPWSLLGFAVLQAILALVLWWQTKKGATGAAQE